MLRALRQCHQASRVGGRSRPALKYPRRRVTPPAASDHQEARLQHHPGLHQARRRDPVRRGRAAVALVTPPRGLHQEPCRRPRARGIRGREGRDRADPDQLAHVRRRRSDRVIKCRLCSSRVTRAAGLYRPAKLRDQKKPAIMCCPRCEARLTCVQVGWRGTIDTYWKPRREVQCAAPSLTP
jgi:hypothetical protein